MPIVTLPGSVPTMLVVSRTRGSSSIATIATTYGTGRLGSHCWWLTVKPTTVARPDTPVTSIARLWQ